MIKPWTLFVCLSSNIFNWWKSGNCLVMGRGRRKMLSSQKKYFITIIIYVALYLLSQTVLSKLYLFRWTATHHYLYVWIFSTVLLYCKKYIVSFSITFGNLFGILIGQFFGDCIKYWIVTIIIFTVVGILVNKRRYVRDESWTGSVLAIVEWNIGKEWMHRRNSWRWRLWGK